MQNLKTSKVCDECQISGSKKLESIIFLGYHPPVNNYYEIGSKAEEQPSYPCELFFCEESKLLQLGVTVNQEILFPSSYPYTSSTTKILRDNFANLYNETTKLFSLDENDLIVDIGSNDGNLLSNFMHKHKVLGVTPEDIGNLAIQKGIPTIIDYFGEKVASQILNENGKAKIITATNVFAHIDNPNLITKLIEGLLDDDGAFISESHYLIPLLDTLQYDTIYHEHLRYYSLTSLKYLLEKNGLRPFKAQKIPTHGGSIRVFACKSDSSIETDKSITEILAEEKEYLNLKSLHKFRDNVVKSKLALISLLKEINEDGKTIVGISAPSRASTLINYVGLDSDIIDCIFEIKGSYKIGKYVPGTRIPVLDEKILYEKQPDYALIFSWHIADDLIANLRKNGFNGKFIIPLPEPKIVQ